MHRCWDWQHLYVWCREELETLSRRHVTTDRDPENGRPGMTLWRVLVMAVLKQGLDCDYDRLGELVNHHRVVRQLLQHGYLDEGTYSVRTLRDNVSLVTPVLLRDLNTLLVREVMRWWESPLAPPWTVGWTRSWWKWTCITRRT